MKNYLSSFTIPALEEYIKKFSNAKLNILLSYGLRNKGYKKFFQQHHKNIDGMALDSGMFTLNNAKDKRKRESICFSGYHSYVKEFGHLFDHCFNYDEDFKKHSVLGNYEYQERLQKITGVRVIPVVHNYDNFDEIDFYIQKGHKLISLGKADDKYKKINKFAHYARDNGVKVHALGVASYSQLSQAPIQYCDSTSWVKYSNVGQILIWDDNKSGDNKTRRFYFTHHGQKDPKREGKYFSDDENVSFLSEYLETTFDYDYFELLNQDRVMKETINIHYYQKLQQEITKIHAQKGFH